MNILRVQHVDTGYGKKQVLFDVSLEVEEGKTILIVGSNGSGKSTLLKVIYGILPIWGNQGGKVTYYGSDITEAKNYELIRKGIMYVPQKNELFEDMTVEQNLEMAILYLGSKKEIVIRLQEVFRQLPILKDKSNLLASKLSGGERKMLSFGMVLLNRPKLLLYDEPLAGLSNNNVKMVLNWLRRIKGNGTTIVIVEHKIKELLSMVDNVVGLKLGRRNTEVLGSLESIKSYML